MSGRALAKNLARDLRNSLRRAQQIKRGHYNRIMRDQQPAAFGAIVNPDTAASSVFQFAMRGKVFRDAKGIRHSQFVAHASPRNKADRHKSITVDYPTQEFRLTKIFWRGVAFGPVPSREPSIPDYVHRPAEMRGAA